MSKQLTQSSIATQ